MTSFRENKKLFIINQKMDIQNIILFNIISAIGVVLLILSHAFISVSNVKRGFLIAALGSFFVSVASFLLKSYPVLFLNIIWCGISLYGYFHHEKKEDHKYVTKYNYGIAVLFLISSIFSVSLYMDSKNYDFLAYNCTFIYLLSYFLFSKKYITKIWYLWWCVAGYFFVVPHLLLKFQYSVLMNESLGAVIGMMWIAKIIMKKDDNA